MKTIWNTFMMYALLIGCTCFPAITQAQTYNTDTDRAALIAIYRATGGESPGWQKWDYTKSPPELEVIVWPINDQNSDLIGWRGVTAENGRVTALGLGGLQLNGVMPTELLHLTELKRLDLSYNNHLTVELPDLSRLTQLKAINLSATSVRIPTIPNSWRTLPLTTLFLSTTGLETAPNWLATDASSKAYDLSNNHLTALPPGLESAQGILVNKNFLSFKDLMPYKSKLGDPATQSNLLNYQQKTAYQVWRAPGGTVPILPLHDDSHASNQYSWKGPTSNEAQVPSSEVAASMIHTPNDDGIYFIATTNTKLAGLTLHSRIYFNQRIAPGDHTNTIPSLVVNPPNQVPSVKAGVETPLGAGMRVDYKYGTHGKQIAVKFTTTGGTLSIGATGITFTGSNGSNTFTATGAFRAMNTALAAAAFTPDVGADKGSVRMVAHMGIDQSNEAVLAFPIAPPPANAILTFSLPGQLEKPVIDFDLHTITVEVPEGTDVGGLVADFTLSTDATAVVSGTTQTTKSTSNNFNHPVRYSVASTDGTSQAWTVIVKKVKTLATDRAALIALYHSTEGAYWSQYDRATAKNVAVTWPIDDKTSDLNSWKGVTVEGNRVTGLNMTSFNAQGTLPAELAHLTALKKLNLSYNNFALSRQLPDLSPLTALEQISLSGAQLRLPAIPDSWKSLVKLNSLFMKNVGLEMLPDWLGASSFSAIKRYDLSNNHLKELPSKLEHERLGWIDISNNFLSFKDLIPYKSKLGDPDNFISNYKQKTSYQVWRAPSGTEVVPTNDDSHTDNQYAWTGPTANEATPPTGTAIATTRKHTLGAEGIYFMSTTNAAISGLTLNSRIYFNQRITPGDHQTTTPPELVVNPPNVVPSVKAGRKALLGEGMEVKYAYNWNVPDASVTLTTTGGRLSIGDTDITFTSGSNGSASFTATGTLAAINTALEAAAFTSVGNVSKGKVQVIARVGVRQSNEAILTFPIAAAPKNAILSFTLPGQAGTSIINHDDHTITIEMPKEVDLTNLVATFTQSPGATVTVAGEPQTKGSTSNDFSNKRVEYAVTPSGGGGTPQIWTVIITAVTDKRTLADDRKALIALYKATGGQTPGESPGWLNRNTQQRTTWDVSNPSSDIDTWQGVTVKNKRVTNLMLFFGLSGKLPPELGDLTALKSLTLYESGLTGTLPDLSRLTQLEDITLGLNTANFSLVKFPEFKGFSQLKKISFFGLKVVDSTIPAEWKHLTTLTNLNLSDTGIEAVPDWFVRLTTRLAEVPRARVAISNNYLKVLPSGMEQGWIKVLKLAGNFLSFKDLIPYTAKFGTVQPAQYKNFNNAIVQGTSYQVWRAPSGTAIMPTNDDDHTGNEYFWTGPTQDENTPPASAKDSSPKAYSAEDNGIYFIDTKNAAIPYLTLRSRIYFNRPLVAGTINKRNQPPGVAINPPDAVPTVFTGSTNVPLGAGMAVSHHSTLNALSKTVSVRFTIAGGVLSIGDTDIDFSKGSNGSASFTATGALAAINTALAAATFTPAQSAKEGKVHVVAKMNKHLSNEAMLFFPILTAQDNAILTFSLPGQVSAADINHEKRIITVEMYEGVDASNLAATFTATPGATITVGGDSQTTGVTTNDFGTPVEYMVQSQGSPTAQKWTVTIKRVKKKVAATGLSFDKSKLNLKVGEKATLKPIFAPTDATDKRLTWVSSNDEVATVAAGVVIALSEGTATITALTSNNKQAQATVKVGTQGLAGIPPPGGPPSNTPLDVKEVKNTLQISPIPTTRHLTVRMDNTTTGSLNLRLSTLLGNVVWQRTDQKTGEVWKQSLDLGDLSQGIYMLEIITDRQHWTRKVMKE